MEQIIKEAEEPVEEFEISGSFEGIPYKGPVIHLKSTDNIEDVLTLHQDLHVERFDLADEKELKEYERVCQKIQDGHSQLSYENLEYIPETRQWVVLVRWIDWWYSPAGDNKDEKTGEVKNG